MDIDDTVDLVYVDKTGLGSLIPPHLVTNLQQEVLDSRHEPQASSASRLVKKFRVISKENIELTIPSIGQTTSPFLSSLLGDKEEKVPTINMSDVSAYTLLRFINSIHGNADGWSPDVADVYRMFGMRFAEQHGELEMKYTIQVEGPALNVAHVSNNNVDNDYQADGAISITRDVDIKESEDIKGEKVVACNKVWSVPSYLTDEFDEEIDTKMIKGETNTDRSSLISIFLDQSRTSVVDIEEKEPVMDIKEKEQLLSDDEVELELHIEELDSVEEETCSKSVVKCVDCGRQLKNQKNLARHRKIHTGITFPCDICEKRYSRRDEVLRHVKRFHSIKL